MKKILSIILILTMTVTLMIPSSVFAISNIPDEIKVEGISVSATVDKIEGNLNKLEITIKDNDDTTTESYIIENNSIAIYPISIKSDNYQIYVDTKGNDKIKECYIISYTKASTISIDTSSFIPVDDNASKFYIEESINVLTGTLTNPENVSDMNITIQCGNLKLVEESIVPSDNWYYSKPNLIIGFPNKVSLKAVMNDGTMIEENIILINDSDENFNENLLDNEDNDLDGLLNWMEDVLGTDKNNLDTDNDKLTDYEEVFITFTNPLLWSTDNNNISDGELDFDKDGLTNIQECYYGSNPFCFDTDDDKLNDYEEIFVYLTNPIKEDSDDDGLPDGLEFKYNMNPNNPDTLGDEILDGKRIFDINQTSPDWNEEDSVKPILNIKLEGNQIENLTIEKVEDTDIFLNSDIPGFIGNAYEFNIDGLFESADLTFEFDKALLDDKEFIPAIYYWNEELQLLEELPEQTIIGNTVSVSLEHFSSYILLNKATFDKIWENDIKPPDSTTKIDLAIVIDNSGSMDADSTPKNDPYQMRHVMAKELIDKLNVDNRVCVVNFSTSAVLRIPFTSDKQAAKTAVDSFVNGGQTALYNAINVANKQFSSNSRGAKNIMVVITDGKDNISSATLASVIQEAQINHVTIYAVGLGSALDTNALTKLATSTGGKYYHATKANDLEEIFNQIAEDDIKIDTDDDELPDYFEKLINAGTLTLGTGVPLWKSKNSIKLSFDDSKNQDSDGDSLKDGEEIKIEFKKNSNGKYRVWVRMFSNPTLKDTDLDLVSDNEDPWPLVRHDFKMLEHVSGYEKRDKWGAAEIDTNDKDYLYINNPREWYDTIVVHHTVRNQYEDIVKLEKNEIKDGFNGMPYHYVIGGNGIVYEGKPINVRGSHTLGGNDKTVGVVLMGNFHPDEKNIKTFLKNAKPTIPTYKQLISMEFLIKVIITQYYTEYVKGHRELKSGTVCPGDILYNILNKLMLSL